MFSKWNGILLLIFILLGTLALSVVFNRIKYEGLTAVELTESGTIKKAMRDYKSEVDKICLSALSKISSVPDITQVESISLSPIIGNESATNVYKIRQIIGLNITTSNIKSILNDVQGQMFSALLTLFSKISEKTTDASFDELVKEQYSKITSIVSDTDLLSPYAILDDFIKTASRVS